jgi:hypothetical protein
MTARVATLSPIKTWNANLRSTLQSARETSAAPKTPTAEPSSTPTSSPSPSPNATIHALAGEWRTYRNEEIGFQFEYPALYDINYRGMECSPTFHSPGRRGLLWEGGVGLRIWFRGRGGRGIELETYLETYLQQLIDSGARISDTPEFVENSGQIVMGPNGEEKVTIEYRFGTLNRYGSTTFILKNDRFVEIIDTAGAACDYDDIGVYEYEAALRIIETFQFID